MEKLGKRIIWVIPFLLLVLVMGCSLKIEIDPPGGGEGAEFTEPAEP